MNWQDSMRDGKLLRKTTGRKSWAVSCRICVRELSSMGSAAGCLTLHATARPLRRGHPHICLFLESLLILPPSVILSQSHKSPTYFHQLDMQHHATDPDTLSSSQSLENGELYRQVRQPSAPQPAQMSTANIGKPKQGCIQRCEAPAEPWCSGGGGGGTGVAAHWAPGSGRSGSFYISQMRQPPLLTKMSLKP